MTAHPRSQARSAARLAAVQALYQRDMDATPIARLLREFHDHRFGMTVEDESETDHALIDAEMDFFDDVVTGVDARREEIDELIAARLATGWTLARLDRTLLQILRCGTYELIARPDVPTGAVIDEYLDVAHAFFDAKDVKFANGLLDALAREARG